MISLSVNITHPYLRRVCVCLLYSSVSAGVLRRQQHQRHTHTHTHVSSADGSHKPQPIRKHSTKTKTSCTYRTKNQLQYLSHYPVWPRDLMTSLQLWTHPHTLFLWRKWTKTINDIITCSRSMCKFLSNTILPHSHANWEQFGRK